MSQFEADINLRQLDDNHFAGHISPAWNIGNNPNGGYLVSVAVKAISLVVGHPDPLSVTTHFLRPGTPDTPCRVEVEIVRTGRTLSTARARLSQEGKIRLEVLAAFGDLAQPAGVSTDITLPRPVMLPPDECLPRDGASQGVELPITSRLDIRLAPTTPNLAEVGGWIRFIDGAEPDPRALLLFCDTFPPSPFNLLGNIGWVPTLELTVHVRRRPAPGWIQAQFRTDDLHEGRMLESGALWDSQGELVAECRQLGLVMRNSST
ncbi:MAG: acyl-CoA thioesterase [Pseudomonadota bacterium]